jgi:hypothetical protein
MSAPKILVVFYSRSGTTRRIAMALSATLGASVEEILEDRGRAGFLGYWKSIIEARRKHLPDILPARNDPSSFDLVVIGTPVWAWSVASPVRAYLTANKDRLPAVAFFCTLGGKGGETAFAQMQALSANLLAPLAPSPRGKRRPAERGSNLPTSSRHCGCRHPAGRKPPPRPVDCAPGVVADSASKPTS